MGTARWALRANKVIKHYANKVDNLSSMLQAGQSERIETNRQMLESRKKIRVLFEKWLCPDRRDAHLVPIGSTISGLAYRESSDVDFTYVPRPDILKDIHSTLNNRERFVNILKERVEELAKEEREWTLAQPVIVPKRTARIPILTAKFTNGCSVDVQLPSASFQSIRNTNLIKQYVSADPRFRTLYFWLHSLFDSLGVLQPKRQLLSSYRAALLCLHFLQTREIDPNVLPIMHLRYIHLVNSHLSLERVEELLEASHKPRLSGWSSKNRKSVGELAVELVHYYADFDPRREAISIRNGQRYRRLDLERNSESLLIFDPYSMFPASASEYLQDLFSALFPFLRKCLENGYLIDSFPYVEEARVFRKRFPGRTWSHFLEETADNETLPPGWRVEMAEGTQSTEVEKTKRKGRKRKIGPAGPTTKEVFPPGDEDVSMGCYAYAASLPVDSLLREEDGK